MTKRQKLFKSFRETERMCRLPVAHSHNGSGFAVINDISPELVERYKATLSPKIDDDYRGAYYE